MRGGVFAGVVFAAAACEYGRREKRREERGEERTPGREAEASLKNSGPRDWTTYAPKGDR